MSAADWASNGYFVNAMNEWRPDYLTTIMQKNQENTKRRYSSAVVMQTMDLTWAEKDNKIAAQTEVVKVGASDRSQGNTYTGD